MGEKSRDFYHIHDFIGTERSQQTDFTGSDGKKKFLHDWLSLHFWAGVEGGGGSG